MAIVYRAVKGVELTNAEVDANFSQLANGSIAGFKQAGTDVERSWISKARETVSPEDFGAVGDGVADDTAAISAAKTYLASVGGGVIRGGRAIYRTTETIDFSGVGIRFEGQGASGVANLNSDDDAGEVGFGVASGQTRIYADFTSGPVIRISADDCEVSGVTIDGSTTRKAAALTTTNCGIRVERADSSSSTTYRFLLRDVRVCNQPGHGVMVVDSAPASRLDMVSVDHVNGHGFFIAGGSYTSRTNRIRPGQIDIWNCRASRTGGHALKVGGADNEVDSSDIPYRVQVINFETFYCCITPSICEGYVSASTDTACVFLSGENHYIIGSAMDGRTDRTSVAAAHSCIRARGRFINLFNCRFIAGNPYAGKFVGHPLMSDVSKSINIENPYIGGEVAPTNGANFYDPAFYFGADVFGVRAVSQNIFSTTASLTSRVLGQGFYDLSDNTERCDLIQIRNKNVADHYQSKAEFSIADDKAAYIDFGSATRGAALISANLGAGGFALVHFRVGDANAHATIVSSSGPTVTGTTGTLAGTTGTDGRLTVSADTASNRLYIENRVGAAYSYALTFVSVTQASAALFGSMTLV